MDMKTEITGVSRIEVALDEIYVDGLDQPGGLEGDGVFAGDGKYAPFVLFNATKQDNMPGIYDTREEAEAQLRLLRRQP